MATVTTQGVAVTTNGQAWTSAGSSFGVPLNFVAEVLDAETISLSWLTVEDADGYRIERQVDSSGTWGPDTFLIVTETSLLDTILSGGKYRYRVRAFRTIV